MSGSLFIALWRWFLGFRTRRGCLILWEPLSERADAEQPFALGGAHVLPMLMGLPKFVMLQLLEVKRCC